MAAFSFQSLDIEHAPSLLEYLRDTSRIPPHEIPSIHILAGGVSNRTVLVERPTGEAWVLKQALPKLRVAVDWFSDPARIRREALGLKHLNELAPSRTIAPLIFEDPAHDLLCMSAVPRPHENWKSMLLAGRLDPDHVQQFATILASVHRESSERRNELAALFDDRSFYESLRIEPYYLYTATQVPESASFLNHLVAQTRQSRHALVHGDFSPKNILVRDHRLVLLDHEVIHWGEPAFDLGFALTHLLSKAHHLRAHRQQFAEAAMHFWKTYRDELGKVPWADDLEPRAVHHTVGCLLARVAGRSPLEYLQPTQRESQKRCVVELMLQPPRAIADLVDQFIDRM